MNLAWAVFGTFFLVSDHASAGWLAAFVAGLVLDGIWEHRKALGKAFTAPEDD